MLLAVDAQPERHELPGPVAKRLLQLGGDLQLDRNRIRRLGEEPLHTERVEAMGARGRGWRRRARRD